MQITETNDRNRIVAEDIVRKLVNTLPDSEIKDFENIMEKNLKSYGSPFSVNDFLKEKHVSSK